MGVMAGIAAMLGCQGSRGVTGGPGGTGDGQLVQRAAFTGQAPAAGESVRVGGDVEIRVSRDGEDFAAGGCSTDAPLPEGYPAPTPPGAIELKTYPSVRRAEVAGDGSPDDGMNDTFWPLFRHIKKHDIAMTAPVEMYYSGLERSSASSPKAWSMAFLYRTAELNQPGHDGRVTVRDSEPVTVLAAGLKGDYSMDLVESGMEAIEGWLGANPDWEAAGDWRSLYYNGPRIFFWNKWAEVQLPIKLSAASPQDGRPAEMPSNAPASN